MDPQLRTVVELRVFEGLSLEEIKRTPRLLREYGHTELALREALVAGPPVARRPS